jgi:hypothetical protein
MNINASVLLFVMNFSKSNLFNTYANISIDIVLSKTVKFVDTWLIFENIRVLYSC